MESILLVDIGSIQTKTLLIEKSNSNWKIISSSRVPTTIEKPENDALVGILQAINKLDDLDTQITLENIADSVKICSSAGGGLQIIALGVVKTMTAESAMRAALGSGAIVTKVISGDNVLKQPERFKQLHNSRPDIILLAGGTDGGNVNQVLDLAETIRAAKVKSRWNDDLAPVIYAGNRDIQDLVKSFLNTDIDLRITENIRPGLEVEETDNANLEIQDLYMNNVIKNVPGLEQFRGSNYDFEPTAVGLRSLIDQWSISNNTNTILFDIGGFTTDSYSSIEYSRREYNKPSFDNQTIVGSVGRVIERKVFSAINASAGLGYGAARLLKSAGIKNICRWIKQCKVNHIYNECFNRILNPVINSNNNIDLSRALAAEALRLSFKEHQEVATKLKGVSITRHMTDAFHQKSLTSGTLASWNLLENIILTGSIFTHLSNEEILSTVNDSLQPTGITNIYVDKNDYLSQLALVDSEKNTEISELINEAINPLATIIAPLPSSKSKFGFLAHISLNYEDDSKENIQLKTGKIHFKNSKIGQKVIVNIKPSSKVDFGNGPGVSISKKLTINKMGIIIDGRRPIEQDFTYSDFEGWYGKNYSNLIRGDHDVE